MRRLLIALCVSLGLAGCAGQSPVTPETPRESLVATEAAYEFAVLQVKSLIVSGYIKPGSDLARNIRLMIVETRAALDAWHVSPDDPSAAIITQAILRRLQVEVAKMVATKETSNESSGPYWDTVGAYAA